jgi:hypothetical protein
MSLLKKVPEGLKPREWERIKLREPPPVPYVPLKDEVQDEVSRMQSLEIKTTIKKDTTQNFAVWQENRTCEAFSMHVTAVLNAIKKRGHVDDYKKAAWEYKKAKKAVETTKAGLALLEENGGNAKKLSKKKTKEGRRTLLQMLQNPSQTQRLWQRLQNPSQMPRKLRLLLPRTTT